MDTNAFSKNLYTKSATKILPQFMMKSQYHQLSFLKAPIESSYPYHDEWLWDWPFDNKNELQDKKNIKKLTQKELANRFNHIHFIKGTILINLKNIHAPQKRILIPARILSCSETTFKFHLQNKSNIHNELQSYKIIHIGIDNGKTLILIPAYLVSHKNNVFSFKLPEIGFEIHRRHVLRHVCADVSVGIVQNKLQLMGILLEFSSIGFRIKLKCKRHLSIKCLKYDTLIDVSFIHGKERLYSGSCNFVRCIEIEHRLDTEIILRPIIHSAANIDAIDQQKIRNPRLNLIPAPSISFEHPIIKKNFQLAIENISSSGFCVYEAADESVLIEGLVIPHVVIYFSDKYEISCKAKVIYCKDEKEHGIRCGFTILDMDLKAYNRLNKVIAHALDPNCYTNNEINMEALWKFFFESNFIYPQKYQHIQYIREGLQKTYKKLYQEDVDIANHFTYQKNGNIYGHISILRAYEKGWMMHHHMAKISNNRPVGFILLKQLLHYFMEMHRLPALNTEYIIGYFRPENKFPARVYGGIHQEASNPKICSMDLFAYMENNGLYLYQQLPENWFLRPCIPADMERLHDFYDENSGGMLLDAMGIFKSDFQPERIENLYNQIGFLRKLRLYSVGKDEDLYAILIIDQSDPGLNLSDLLNSIKVMVIKPEKIAWKLLFTAITQLMHSFKMKRIPLLIYPFEYVTLNDITINKRYQLMIYNASRLNEIAGYFKKRFNMSYWP